ncbi:MAG: heparinase II/III family protein [Oscillospiraceae bacterium]|jgi:hypothetical protein|nr:heparinase II/III family protein [Oscillospiraceae bacterium]
MTKSEFFGRPGKRFFFDDAFAVAEYVKNNCPEQIAAVISAADDAVKQRFMFVLRWDMEQTSEPVIFDGEIDWLYQPGGDPEWIYAFNRMRFWICLGQAYALTGDEKYAEAFVRQLTGWIENIRRDNPECAKAWRSIEAGLRLEYWLKAICYFEKSPALTDEVITLFAESVIDHAEFLMGIWDSYHIMSNWGVLENHGLFMAGVMLPESGRSGEYVKEAIRRLELESRMQIYRDGTQWEQSPMYHNEVLSCCLDVLTLAGRNKIALPLSVKKKIYAMLYFDLYSAKPNHCEICMGDSDEIDQRDVLTRGAYLFWDEELKSRAYKNPDFDSVWDIGEKGVDEYSRIEIIPPENTDKAFPDSGNFYFRSGWKPDATFAHFHCGTLGAGHGHADQFHFDLFSRGEDVLLDPGRFTYVFGEDRIAFKEQAAHNIIMPKGKELYVCEDSWLCRNLSRAVNQQFYSDENYGYAEGGNLGYVNSDGIYINRRLIFIKPDILVIADEIYSPGNDSYRQYFHWNNAGNLNGEGNCCVYESGKVRAETVFLAGDGRPGTPCLTVSMKKGQISRRYNQKEEGAVTVTDFSGNGFTSAFTVIALSDAGRVSGLSVERLPVYSNFKGIRFDDSQVEALEIKTASARCVLAMAHEEFASPTDTFLAGGCTGFGSAVIFDRLKSESEIGTVLRY